VSTRATSLELDFRALLGDGELELRSKTSSFLDVSEAVAAAAAAR